jgi:hypothetical protein
MEKLKITKLSAIGIVISIMMMAMSPVFASWSQVGTTEGSWQIATRTQWQTLSGMESGSMEWEYLNISDFAGYFASINFSWLVNEANWYEPQVLKKLEITWNISNIYVHVDFEDVKNFGGVLDNMWVYCGSAVNNSGFTASYWEWWATRMVRSHTDFNRNWKDYFEVQVSKKADTTVLVEIYKYGLSETVRMISNEYTVSSDFWNGTDITMKIHHEGKGYLYGEMSDTIYTGSWSPDIPETWNSPLSNPFWDFINNLAQTVTSVLPQFLRNWLNQLGAWSGYLFGLIGGILMGIVTTVIPFLPLLLVFYVVDAGMTSVITGSITPLGNCFLALYNLVTAIISALVGIIQTIYDFIHFW